ncbi:MAG: hypothetical protein WDW36_007589 [Sanguina aurantia]
MKNKEIIAPDSPLHTSKSVQETAAQHSRTLILSGIAYCVCSASLILLNKYALSSFGFQCPTLLLVFHCSLAVLLVWVTETLGYITVEPLKWEILRMWAPVNLLFVAMLVTSFYALRLLGVGTFTVLKNLTNLFTISGDRFIYGKSYSWQVWMCLFLMAVSAVLGGFTDLSFSLEGYSWQVINCAITSAYSLYLSGVMIKVAPYTRSGERMTEFSMVYYNNLLSLPPLLILAAVLGEFQTLPLQTALTNPAFINVAFLGGLIGFGISFSSLWYLSNSSATIYSLTGSMNKILVAVAGILIFQEATSTKNMASIGVGLIAALVFVCAKDLGPRDGIEAGEQPLLCVWAGGARATGVSVPAPNTLRGSTTTAFGVASAGCCVCRAKEDLAGRTMDSRSWHSRQDRRKQHTHTSQI